MRDYNPDDDYAEDDQLAVEEAARQAAEEAADMAAYLRDMETLPDTLGPWPTDEEIAEYERQHGVTREG